MAMFDVRQADLAKLNSLTKYPSIPTYHVLDEGNGSLGEDHVAFDGRVLATEKVDGTNSRVICLPDGSYLLGSREELLYARGDLIGNPSMGIVAAMKDKADELRGRAPDRVRVFFCEFYGGAVTANSRQYTGERRAGFRLFDVAEIEDYAAVLDRPAAAIAAWRDGGGQRYLAEDDLRQLAAASGLELTPRVAELDAGALPGSLVDGLAFLQRTITKSGCVLDDKAGGRPEGLVVRTPDRRVIAKLRFQDYERTLKRREKDAGSGRRKE